MPSNVSFTVDTRRAERLLRGVSKANLASVSKRLRALGRRIRDDIRSDIPRRTGTAARAVFSRMDRRRRKGRVGVMVGADLSKAPYLATLESGALIRPKTASKLAIPIGAAVTAGGAARFSAAAVKANPGAFGFRTTFVSKDVVLGERAGGLVPLFVLKPSVVITRREYFKRALRRWESRIVSEVDAAVKDGVKVAVQRSRG